MTARTIVLALSVCGASVLAAPHAAAQRVSPMMAGKFAQICTTPRLGGNLVCDAYISGMADTLALSQQAARNNGDQQFKLDVCIPSETTGPGMRDKVLSWLRGHRDRLRSPVGEVVYAALRDSYPCNGGKPGG